MWHWLFSDPLKLLAREQVRRLRPLPAGRGQRASDDGFTASR
jgi:hypothetical protein